jgi:hypothetical protein
VPFVPREQERRPQQPRRRSRHELREPPPASPPQRGASLIRHSRYQSGHRNGCLPQRQVPDQDARVEPPQPGRRIGPGGCGPAHGERFH